MFNRGMLVFLIAAAPILAESAAGISWTAPSGWTNQGERPMRAATYTVPAAAGGSEPGECGVFYFGRGQGGSVQANLDRWTAQFEPSNGKPQIANRTIHGLKVTTVDESGTYNGMGGPMSKQQSSKANYRLLGAIVEGPQGAVFFKFTGPAKTVAANQGNFEKLLNSLK